MGSIILGIIQGLTEFLPISSSGHLVLAGAIFKLSSQSLFYDVCLHMGTLLAVLVYFRYEIIELFTKRLKWLGLLLIGSIPAGVVGVILRNRIEFIFNAPLFSAGFLLVTSVILFSTRFAKEKDRDMEIRDAILIGIAQAIAIFPGISRSGITIATALFLGVAWRQAFEFSFLLSVPAILGAMVLEIKELTTVNLSIGSGVLGVISSFLFGLLALWILKGFLRKGRFSVFGFYCLIVGVGSLLYLTLSR